MQKKSRSLFRFKQLAAIACIVATSALSAACHGDDGHSHDEEVDCDLETRAQAYVAGLVGADSTDIEISLLESVPGPPTKGDSTWRIQVLDSAGMPMDNLSVTATPFMPDHGHGTPNGAEVTELAEPGEYEIAPVNLWMPGLWETTIEISDGAGLSDMAVFSFCIEG